MNSQWNAWLQEMKRVGKGGSAQNMTALTPGLAWSHVFALPADYSADSFAADVMLSPDADGTPLASCTVTVGSYSGGYTNVTLSLSTTQSTAIAAAAGDADGDGLGEAIFFFNHTPSGGSEYRAIGTNLVIGE